MFLKMIILSSCVVLRTMNTGTQTIETNNPTLRPGDCMSSMAILFYHAIASVIKHKLAIQKMGINYAMHTGLMHLSFMLL